VKGFNQVTDRIDVTLSEGTLSICPLTENAVRIKFYKDEEIRIPELVFTSGIQTSGFQVSDSPSKLEVREKNIIVLPLPKVLPERGSCKMYLTQRLRKFEHGKKVQTSRDLPSPLLHWEIESIIGYFK